MQEKISQWWSKCSTYLKSWYPNSQMRSMEWIQLTGVILHGHIYLWLVVKVISLSHAKVYVFSDSVLCFGKMNENAQSNYAWEDRLMWFKSSSEYRALDNWWWSTGIRVEYFLRIHHIAALQQSPGVPVENERKARRIYRTDHLHVDVQRHLMEI